MYYPPIDSFIPIVPANDAEIQKLDKLPLKRVRDMRDKLFNRCVGQPGDSHVYQSYLRLNQYFSARSEYFLRTEMSLNNTEGKSCEIMYEWAINRKQNIIKRKGECAPELVEVENIIAACQDYTYFNQLI